MRARSRHSPVRPREHRAPSVPGEVRLAVGCTRHRHHCRRRYPQGYPRGSRPQCIGGAPRRHDRPGEPRRISSDRDLGVGIRRGRGIRHRGHRIIWRGPFARPARGPASRHRGQMDRAAQGGQGLKEQLDHAGLAQAPKPLPDAGSGAGLGRQRPLGDVVHGERGHGFEERAMSRPLSSRRDRQARNTSRATAPSSSVICVSMVGLATGRPAMNHRKAPKGKPLRRQPGRIRPLRLVLDRQGGGRRGYRRSELGQVDAIDGGLVFLGARRTAQDRRQHHDRGRGQK